MLTLLQHMARRPRLISRASRASRASRIAVASVATVAGAAGAALAPVAPATAVTTSFTGSSMTLRDADFSLNAGLDGVTTISSSSTGASTTYGQSITVSGRNGALGTVTAEVRLTHANPDDLDLLLVSPAGKAVVLMSDAGGSADLSNTTLTFSDTAATTLPDTAAISTGAYKPTNHAGNDAGLESWPAPAPSVPQGSSGGLAGLAGDSPNGTWKLYVADDAAGGGGSLSSFSLSFSMQDRISPANPYPSTIKVSGMPKGVTDVNVTVKGLSHTSAADIDLVLVGPQGLRTFLISDVGGIGDFVNAQVTFDDDAGGVFVSPFPAPVTGVSTVKPINRAEGSADVMPGLPDLTSVESRLSVFDGTDPNGTWSLYAVDDERHDTGSIAGWTLDVSTVDPPATPAVTAPSSATTYTRDTTVTMSGITGPSNVVTVYDGGVEAGQSIPSGQTWTATLGGLAEGKHVLTATATDSHGNVSPASAPVTVVVDTSAPRMKASSPAAGATGVSRSTKVTATASEALLASTVDASTVWLVKTGTSTHLPATVTYDPATQRIELTPSALLAADTTYRLVVAAVQDLAGNTLDQNVSLAGIQQFKPTFTTGG